MAAKVRYVADLASQVRDDAGLQEQMKKDPVETLAKLASPLETDNWIYRIVVGALGLTVLLSIVSAVAIAMTDRSALDFLTAVGSAAVGALAGLLAPSPARQT